VASSQGAPGGQWPYARAADFTYVVTGEVVDRGLAQHGVVLELTLTERRSVGGNDDQLGLAGAEGLDGRLVAQGDCSPRQQCRPRFENVGGEDVCDNVPLPDFITSARRELMLSPDFLLFLGAISTQLKSSLDFR